MNTIFPKSISVTAQAKRELEQVSGTANKNTYVSHERIREYLMGRGVDSYDGKRYCQVVSNGFFKNPTNPVEFICVLPVFRDRDEAKNVDLIDYEENSQQLLDDTIRAIEAKFFDPFAEQIFSSVVQGLQNELRDLNMEMIMDRILSLLAIRLPNSDQTALYNSLVAALKADEKQWKKDKEIIEPLLPVIEDRILHPRVDPEEHPEITDLAEIQTADMQQIGEDGIRRRTQIETPLT